MEIALTGDAFEFVVFLGLARVCLAIMLIFEVTSFSVGAGTDVFAFRGDCRRAVVMVWRGASRVKISGNSSSELSAIASPIMIKRS
jgi:hypothetical protein